MRGNPLFSVSTATGSMNPIEMQGFATMTDKKTSMLTVASLLVGSAVVVLAFTKRKAIVAATSEGLTTIKASLKRLSDKMENGLIADPLTAIAGRQVNGSGEAPIPARGH